MISKDFANPVDKPVIALLVKALYVPQNAEDSLSSPNLVNTTLDSTTSTATLPCVSIVDDLLPFLTVTTVPATVTSTPLGIEIRFFPILDLF